MSTVSVTNLKNAASATNNIVLNSDGSATFPSSISVSGGNISPNTGFVNRLINGDMRIDQRNAGASVTPTGSAYTLDRWQLQATQASKLSVQQITNQSAGFNGFPNYMRISTASAYSVLAGDFFAMAQKIEAFNTSDLGWGTANAQNVTISFVVNSTLTGTYGGSITNSNGTRSYPFTFSVPTANAWTEISLTIPGDTSGTWSVASNASGMILYFGLGVGSTYSGTAGSWASANYVTATGATSVVGTSGATFYITGVSLVKGSTALPWEFRSYGDELALCQRYYYKLFPQTNTTIAVGYNETTSTGIYTAIPFPVTMRANPTALEQTGTAGDYSILYGSSGVNTLTSVPTFAGTNASSGGVRGSGSAVMAANAGSMFRTTGANGYLAWSAEL